jgi:hypothetical protein
MRSPIGLGIKQSTAGHNLILNPGTPWDSGLAFLETKYSAGDTRTLLHQGGVFYGWTGTHYPTIDLETIRSEIYYFLDSADCVTKDGDLLLPFAPTARRVTDVVDALKGATNLSGRHPPTWLSDASNNLPPFEIIAWCQICGRDWPGTIQTFGRDLRAAVPGLKVSHPRDGKGRQRIYEGVGFKSENPKGASAGSRT